MNDYPDLLAWVDTETTQLEPERGALLELGIILTDSHLAEISRASWIVHLDRADLPLVSEWSLQQHAKSGLLAECLKSDHDIAWVEREASIWLNSRSNWIGHGRVPMAGASVHFDRAWLRRHVPGLEKWFYYGNLDVSSIEKIARLWHPELPKWNDRGLHRVQPDNEDAINELRYYLSSGVLTAQIEVAA